MSIFKKKNYVIYWQPNNCIGDLGGCATHIKAKDKVQAVQNFQSKYGPLHVISVDEKMLFPRLMEYKWFYRLTPKWWRFLYSFNIMIMNESGSMSLGNGYRLNFYTMKIEVDSIPYAKDDRF